MPLGIERAAAYVPRTSVQGRRSAAADEDGFTMAATALERLGDGGPPAGPPPRLLVAGELPPSADADLPRFLGVPVTVERVGSGIESVLTALSAVAVATEPPPPILFVAVDRGSGGPNDPDAAVALRCTADGAVPVDRVVAELEGKGTPSAGPLLRFGTGRAAAEPSRWVGDFAPGAVHPVAPTPRETPLVPNAPVSQGAYVPRPRYLEGVGAHWRFEGERCDACGATGFPPRGRCRSCGATDRLRPMPLPRDGGVVVASTTIGPGGQPTELDEQVERSGPYGVVLVDLVPGVRVTLPVADSSASLAIGRRVGTRLRRLYPMEGEWRYGRKAVPLE